METILLGTVRKSMTLIDRPDREPIRRLAYFESQLEGVLSESLPPYCWRHLEFNLGRCEEYWRDRPAATLVRTRPELEQVNLLGGGPKPSPATGQE